MFEFIKYFLASGAALAVDVALFHLFIALGAPVLVAGGVGFCSGLVLIYILSARLVFKSHRYENRSVEFLIFAVIGLLGLCLTEFVLVVTVHVIGLPPLHGKALSAGIVFMFNFFSRRAVLFTEAHKKVLAV